MAKSIGKRALIAEWEPMSAAADAYRMLRSRLKPAGRTAGARGQVLTVVSAAEGEGRTTTLANLAVVYAAEGNRVLLIDGHTRRPGLHHLFQVTNTGGLPVCLADADQAGDQIKTTHIPHLDLLTAGTVPTVSGDLLRHQSFEKLIDRLRADYDIILLDTPPLLGAAESSIMASCCDAVVLAASTRHSDQASVRKALKQLQQAGITPVGTILNQA